MAGDFMTPAVKAYDFIGADPGPVAGPLIDQPARDIEGSPRVVRLENGRAGGDALFGTSSNVKLTIGLVPGS